MQDAVNSSISIATYLESRMIKRAEFTAWRESKSYADTGELNEAWHRCIAGTPGGAVTPH